MVRTRSGLDTNQIVSTAINIVQNPANVGQNALAIATAVSQITGYTPEQIAGIVVRQGSNFARNLLERGVRAAGRAANERLQQAYNDYQAENYQSDAVRQNSADSQPRTPRQPIAQQQPDSGISVNMDVANKAPTATTSTQPANQGGNLTNTVGSTNTLERLPKGPSNGPHTRTETFNNCYRVLITNEKTGITPKPINWPVGSVTEGQPFPDSDVFYPSAIKFGTPWKYITNNNLKNYMTPKQWEREMRKGAVAYRFKSCSINVHGLYNMQRYNFSNTLQGQDTGYLAVCEPKNNLFLNARPNNYYEDTLYNDTQNFVIGDNYEYSVWINSAPTPVANTLPTYKIAIPFPFPSTGNVADLDADREFWYPDLTMHEGQTLVRNGQTYAWHWENNDSRYIATYPNDINGADQATKNYDFAPIQLLQDGIHSHLEFYAGQGGYPGGSKFAGLGMDQLGNKAPTMMHPLLVKIPQLTQPGGEDIVHSAWMYLDYSCEVEFMYGQNMYTHGFTGSTADGRYAQDVNSIVSQVQYLGNPKQYNYPTYVQRQKWQERYAVFPYNTNYEPRIPPNYVTKKTCMDNTFAEPTRVGQEGKDYIETQKKKLKKST